ncbi:hypothetical protein GOQ30_06800 [Flavobacterium sp. TP390]|uniref:Uncharacterized protein n=1 Tax=Flavobacterium profundi TaxID=1774945 RepID=A0A6I4IL28_9FLAO|nr:hypothetical protein [Flavobacterium profundi]MVO08872.1 hypothetical protein [Flavobacterium profundi]
MDILKLELEKVLTSFLSKMPKKRDVTVFGMMSRLEFVKENQEKFELRLNEIGNDYLKTIEKNDSFQEPVKELLKIYQLKFLQSFTKE